MDKDFQDRIDRFLLHGSEMTKEERAAFLGEIENDEEKKAQYQFTIMVRDAMRSRMSKLEAMKVMEYFDHVASADNAPALTFFLICALIVSRFEPLRSDGDLIMMDRSL